MEPASIISTYELRRLLIIDGYKWVGRMTDCIYIPVWQLAGLVNPMGSRL